MSNCRENATRPRMSTNPLITMITCCYNQQDVAGAAFEAMLAQDYSPLEIIISDDCSQDGTFAVLQAIAAAYKGPHKVVLNRNSRNLGIAAHFDRVTELASAEFIVGGAGDDLSLPHRVRQFAEAWLASGKRAHVIHGPCIMLNEAGTRAGIAHPPPQMCRTPEPAEFARNYLYVIGANMGWTRYLLERFGPVSRHALVEDHVLPFRAALIGEIAYIDEPLVLKRPGGVANLAVAQNGFDALFGLHLKELPWKLGDYRQFEADLEHVDRPDKDKILASVRRRAALHAMEYRMATAGPAGRLAALPGAIAIAVARGDRHYLKRALLYAGAPLSHRWIDRRMARNRVLQDERAA